MTWEMGTAVVPNLPRTFRLLVQLLGTIALIWSPETMMEKNPKGPCFYYCLSLEITSCSHSWLRVTLTSGFYYVSRGTVDMSGVVPALSKHMTWIQNSLSDGCSPGRYFFLCYRFDTWVSLMTNDEIILAGFSFIPLFLMFQLDPSSHSFFWVEPRDFWTAAKMLFPESTCSAGTLKIIASWQLLFLVWLWSQKTVTVHATWKLHFSFCRTLDNLLRDGPNAFLWMAGVYSWHIGPKFS